MLTPVLTASAEVEIRRSRFIGSVHPVSSRAQAMQTLAALRAAHPGARHVCWVLLCEGASGMDDDGEPGGTAARPMYNVLHQRGIGHVLAVVVRYFGGVKLGAGGLARAYSQATVAALDAAALAPVVESTEQVLCCAFADESRVRRWCELNGLILLGVQYTDAVALRVSLAKDALPALRGLLAERFGPAVALGRE